MAKDACGWLLKKHQEKQRTFGKPAFTNLKTAILSFSSAAISHSRWLYLEFCLKRLHVSLLYKIAMN